jgi:hypothetical protein
MGLADAGRDTAADAGSEAAIFMAAARAAPCLASMRSHRPLPQPWSRAWRW